MANSLTYTQISTILSDIVKQATGIKPLTPVNSAQFTSVATTALQLGYDPIMQAISQVMNRTIFAIRPYDRKFRGLDVTRQQFGGFTRKLQLSDSDWNDDVSVEIKDNQSVDMYVINMPKPLQTNFYGQVVFERHITTFLHQLDLAFRNADELGQFWTMQTQNAHDQIEQAHESLARAVIGNFIAGKTVANPDSVIHLITEYNEKTGLALTNEDIYKPENYPAFIKWVYGRIATLCSLMTERTVKFQVNIDGTNTPHHTPYSRQRVYLYAPERYSIESRVLSDSYHDTFLRLAVNETVNFWQNIDKPDEIDMTPVYLLNDGLLQTAGETQVKKVLGVIMDTEAAGYTVVNEWQSTTPLNSRGGYWNTFFHFTDRYYNDYTEKGIILLLD